MLRRFGRGDSDMQHPIDGYVAAGFEPVREVFERNFTDDVEVGAAVCVVSGGETLVDLWGGYVDQEASAPWREDTLVNVYSTTKGVAALAFALLVQDGLISYDDPVRDYWPELEAARDGLTVGQLLAHQGGLCGVSGPLSVEDLYDWTAMIGRLETQAPFWTPGAGAGYHAVVWGFLPGELTRRLTGMTLGELLATRLAGPLEADFYIGLPESEDSRVAPVIGPNRARIQPDLSAFAGLKMPALYPVALQNPVIKPHRDASSPAWRRAEIAAANGQANARGIARVYSAAASPAHHGDIFARGTIDVLIRERVGLEPDLVLGMPIRRGAGVILNTEGQYGPGPSSFGHSGAGGSVGFADPDRGLAFGYAMNQMQTNLDGDTRAGRLINAVYRCLA